MENKMVHCVILLVHAWQQELIKRWLLLLYFLQQAVFQRRHKETPPPIHFRQSRTDQRKECVHEPLGGLCCWLQWRKRTRMTHGGQLNCRRVPCVDMTHRIVWGNEVAMLGKSPQPHGWLMTVPAAITEEVRGQLSGTCPPGDFYSINCLLSIQSWGEGPWDPWESSRACLELHLPQESLEQLPSLHGKALTGLTSWWSSVDDHYCSNSRWQRPSENSCTAVLYSHKDRAWWKW